MSGKRFNPLDNPPAASSSEEEEEENSTGEGEETEGSSSSDEENGEASTNPTIKKPETVLASKEKTQVSDSESGSEEETDSDSETEIKDPVKIPVSSVVKSAKDSEKVKPLAKSVSKKRSLETDGGAEEASKDAKRVKKVSGDETKKTYFQRLWSEEDEISVLQGIIDYKTDTGMSPYDDTNGFYQLVKKSISFDVTKIQFMEKLRGLKKKFENNLGRGKNGEEPTFSKSHDQKAFDLSKLIWGTNGMALESAVKSNGKSNKSLISSKSKSKLKKVEPMPELVSSLFNGEEVTDKGEVGELDKVMKSSLVKSLGVDDLAAQQGWSKLATEDKKRFEEQWKVLQAKEFEFYSQKSGFIHEVVTKMSEALKPNS